MKTMNVVAIDGEVASGKSVCAILAKLLGWKLLGTGIIYRAIAHIILMTGIDPNDRRSVARIIEMNINHLQFVGEKIAFEGIILDKELRTDEVKRTVHLISKQPAVRKLVVPLQRDFAGGNRIVAEGRDMGSVIFPDARAKFYLTAAFETRVQRDLNRYREDGNLAITFEEVAEIVHRRDEEDKNREDSPLIRVPDAEIIDSTNMTKDQVVDAMYKACLRKGCVPVPV